MSNAGGTCEFNEKFTFNKKAEDTVLKVCHCSHWPFFALRNDSLLNFKSARPYCRPKWNYSTGGSQGQRDSFIWQKVGLSWRGPQNAGILCTSNCRYKKIPCGPQMQVNYDNISYKTQLFTVCLRICAAVAQIRIYMHARQLSSKFGVFEYVERWKDTYTHDDMGRYSQP
jgi:hypothetical protein